MSKTQESKKERPEIVDSIIEVFQKNGTILTVSLIAIILIGGISLIENRDSWWVLVGGICMIALTVFLFMNARIVIKIVIVSLMNLFMGTTAFQIGSFVDNLGTGGLVWMAEVLFTFFALLAYSYATTSTKSRWTTLGISTIIGFVGTYILSIGGLNTTISSGIGFAISAIVFVLIYKTGKKNTFKESQMPENYLDEKLNKLILELFKSSEWDATSLKEKDKDQGSIIVWEDKGYVLYPVKLEEAFSRIEERRRTMLGYQENNINPWLLHLVHSEIPVWKSRNANLNLVLLDLNNRNGKKARVIGVNIPDSNKKIPVGIIPAKSLLSGNLKEADNIITMLDAELSVHTRTLSDKQKSAMSRIGKTNDKSLDKKQGKRKANS